MNSRFRTFTLWIVVLLGFLLLAQKVKNPGQVAQIPLAELMALAEEGRPEVVASEGIEKPNPKPGTNAVVLKVADHQGVLKGEYIDPETVETKPFETEYNIIGGQGRDILDWARRNGVAYKAVRRNEFLTSFLPQILVMVVVLVVLWVLLARYFQSGSNKAMSFGKSRAKLVTEGQVKVSFKDVAGIDEVKEELEEIIEFLKDPDRFSRLGGRIPKGALLHGPPGTGKTLIARATAGEASVPFFSISGSDFVEMFVGVGASRVRDLFEQGKKAKPCLIYIDEIDAVGRNRFSGHGGGHDEREQTLNQLLVELDGFAPNEGVIVMASTNRPDVLDPALLRPGRFDRQIRVDLPDVVGREKVLEVHTRDLKMGEEIRLKEIAKGTPGFSGADLANLANEAALLAARSGKESVSMVELEEAKDRVMMGPMRRSMAMGEKERIHTAYHETGHALVAKFCGQQHRVHKVTVIPRGRTLGVTAVLPDEEKHSQNRTELLQMLEYMMGGRAAEEVKFDDTSTGASNDLQRATDIAHRMVCEFGMSEALGPRTFGNPSQPVFLGRDVARDRDYSEETASIIDREVRAIVQEAYDKAEGYLRNNPELLETVSLALLDRETLSGDELDMLMRGEELPPLFKENGEKSDDDEPETEQTDEKEVPGDDGPPPIQDPSVQPS